MKIAVTGGIGSGKSYVCRLLEQRGIRIYDCDSAAKRLMRTDSSLQRQLISLIGANAYVGGVLNKAAVASFLLQSKANAQAIDAIVHPAVARDFRQSGCRWMECAILFESGFHQLVDKVVVVTAPQQVRLQRVMDRDHISREKALQWMQRQLPQEEVVERAHFCIANDGIEPLEPQVQHLLEQIENIRRGTDSLSAIIQ
ncbi:MAG: dephospho-CoA kinase [Prevotella sp.]